ncbi:MAG TPA: hypothetical protein VF530_07670 [Planctomycetota bacterium]
MSGTAFDPDVLALLDEIARSPEGRLLRIPRERLPTYFGDERELLTPHGSFLSKAERHLITAYREQAASVLLDACIMKLREDPMLFATRVVNEPEMQRKAELLSSRLAGEPEVTRTLEFLSRSSGLSSTQLAAASLRIGPSDLGINALAVSYQDEGLLGSSSRLLARFFQRGASNPQRAQGIANMGRLHVLRGEFLPAWDFACKAYELDSSSRFAAWSLTAALQGGLEPQAVRSAQLLDECEAATDFDELRLGIVAGRRSGAWLPTPASRRLIPRIRDTVASRSGAICDAFS